MSCGLHSFQYLETLRCIVTYVSEWAIGELT